MTKRQKENETPQQAAASTFSSGSLLREFEVSQIQV
jgi:hypothetical protein